MGISGSGFFRGARAWSLAVVACAGALIVASSCTRSGGIFGRTTTTRAPASGNTLDTVNYTAQLQAARAAGQTPWWCKAEGLGGHMDHTDNGGLAHDAYAGQTKGTLSSADCTALTTQFDQIIRLIRPYKTRGDARRAGMSQLVQFVKGLGTHDTVRGFTRVGSRRGRRCSCSTTGPPTRRRSPA